MRNWRVVRSFCQKRQKWLYSVPHERSHNIIRLDMAEKNSDASSAAAAEQISQAQNISVIGNCSFQYYTDIVTHFYYCIILTFSFSDFSTLHFFFTFYLFLFLITIIITFHWFISCFQFRQFTPYGCEKIITL